MKSIILIGYMGSGKSSAARALSDKLGIPVTDTDAHIEADEGMKISDIFDRFGEDRFRDMETELLHDLIKERKVQVVSTGGGMPVREENRKLLKDLGSVVYLKASPEQIAKRLEHDTTRPLLAGTTVLREKIERIEA